MAIPLPTDVNPADAKGNLCNSCVFMATKIEQQYCLIEIKDPLLVDMDMPSCSEYLKTNTEPLTVLQYQALSSSDLSRRMKK